MSTSFTVAFAAALRKQFAEVQLVRGARPAHNVFALFNSDRAIQPQMRAPQPRRNWLMNSWAEWRSSRWPSSTQTTLRTT